MNKELILKAVQAVMDINELESRYIAGVQVGTYSIWVYIMDTYKNCQYVLTNQNAQTEDVNFFIQKLNELKGEENE